MAEEKISKCKDDRREISEDDWRTWPKDPIFGFSEIVVETKNTDLAWNLKDGNWYIIKFP